MTNISSDIFRMYDIRGIYGQDLTDETAYIIGKGLGTFYQQNNVSQVVVGRDNRLSGEHIKSNFIKGLLETSCNVIDIGIVLAPFTYFSWYDMDANASVMITASHNPAEYNGFKFSLNKKPLVGDDYQKVKQICLNGSFTQGKGQISDHDIWPAYRSKILSSIKLNKKIRVGLDCGNGTASLFAPTILTDLGCEVYPFYCESDGSFPNHQPYPQKTEYYTDLINKIKTENLDMGLSFDGDGDRLGVFDNKENFIEGDRLAMLFAGDICQNNPGAKIVMNVSTSLSFIDYINSLGGEFLFSKTGYPYVTAKMNESKALFGGEISGHFFFKDKYFGYDDALYAAFRILEIVSNSEKPLSEIIISLPRFFETREFRIEVPSGQDKFEIINKVKNDLIVNYPQIQMMDMDGIRFNFSEGWGLIRASNTEPLISGRAEAKSVEQLQRIKKIIKDFLLKYNVELNWEKFR